MHVTSTSIVWSCSSSQPNLLLPLFLFFQPQAAEGDIFAAEDSKKKTKPKGTKKEKSKKPKGRSDEDLSGTTNHIFGDSWLLLKPRVPRPRRRRKVEQTTVKPPSSGLLTNGHYLWPHKINILFLVSAYIYAGHRCMTCVFSMQPQ